MHKWVFTFLIVAVVAGCGSDNGGQRRGTGGGPVTGGGQVGGGAALNPIKVGYRWTYDVKGLPPCASGEQTSEVLSESKQAGRQAFLLKGFCSGSINSHVYADGDKLYFLYQNEWKLSLDAPKEGHTWSPFPQVTFTWTKAPATTTPAGTFSDCWKKTQKVSYEAWDIYCRGVGLVRSVTKGTGFGWDVTLLRKNF